MQISPYSLEHRAGVIACFRSNIPAAFRESEERGFLEFVESDAGPYLVAIDGEQVIGCAGYAFRGMVGDLCWGMVHRDHQGRGVGARLLLHRVEAMSGTATRIRLETTPETETFFARYGFSVAERVVDGYGEGFDKVEMTLASNDFRTAIARMTDDISNKYESPSTR